MFPRVRGRLEDPGEPLSPRGAQFVQTKRIIKAMGLYGRSKGSYFTPHRDSWLRHKAKGDHMISLDFCRTLCYILLDATFIAQLQNIARGFHAT